MTDSSPIIEHAASEISAESWEKIEVWGSSVGGSLIDRPMRTRRVRDFCGIVKRNRVLGVMCRYKHRAAPPRGFPADFLNVTRFLGPFVL